MSESTEDWSAKLAEKHAASRAESLPPQCYHSPSFFAVEAEKIFKRGWISIAHTSQIPNAGDYVCHDLLDESLIVTRDESMRVHVLSRVCLHRWTEIVSGSGNAERLVCPFHAWAYSLDGALTGAPVTGGEPDFDISQCRLHAYKHEIQDGFVFVNLSADAPALGPQIAPLQKQFTNYRLGELTTLGVLEYDCEYDWKILVETFMESYHHLGIHVGNLETIYPARNSFAHPGTDAYALLENPSKPDAPVDDSLPVMSELTANEQSRFFVYNVFPFHLVALFPHTVAWFRVVPVAAGRCRLGVFVMAEQAVAESLPANARQAVLDWIDVINREDITVNLSQQRGLRSAFASPGRFNKLEQANLQFTNYLCRRVAAN